MTRVVIVGGGMAGLAAAYALRHHGDRVRLLEARDLAGPRSSSFGATRMFREMYSDPYLCGQARLANQLWVEAEVELGLKFRRTHGLLFYGESWDEETIEGSIPGARRVMDAQGIPYEALDADAIRARWPLAPRPEFTGLFEPTAGAVLSDVVLRAWAQACRQAGVSVEVDAPVSAIEPVAAGGARLRLASGEEVRADRVVLAAGAWTPRLLQTMGVQLRLEAWSMLWAHYAVDPDRAAAYPQWFCFQQARGDDGGLYYGFPVMSQVGGRPVIKAGIDWAPDSMKAPAIDRLPSDPDPVVVGLLDDFVRTGLHGVGERVETFVSPYTMSPDVQFVLDEVHPGVAVFTGGSGQAFKFAPLIGALLADLVEGRPPRVDIGPWRAGRPAVAGDGSAAAP